MPRQRREADIEATMATIKATARQLMADNGTAGLSLRAIARAMGMTAPALYHYFASLDDLITALIVDAFTGHAAFVRQARDASAAQGCAYTQQIFAAAIAYRAWALKNTVDFQLIYGNPIPGYTAPQETTTPAARSMGTIFMETVSKAVQAGEFQLAAAYQRVPSTVQAHYQHKFGMDGATIQLFHAMNQAWSMMHGIVVLEVYNHAAPVVGDTTAFYEQALRNQLYSMGLVIS